MELLKKSLCASAVMALCAPAAAATLTPSSVVSGSVEAAQLMEYTALSSINVALDKDVQVGTAISLIAKGAAFVENDDCEPSVDSNQVAFSTLSDDGKSAIFVVTSNLVGSTFNITGLCVDGADANDNDDEPEVEVSAEAELSGLVFEQAEAVPVVDWYTAFAAEVDYDLSATIDVEEERTKFVGDHELGLGGDKTLTVESWIDLDSNTSDITLSSREVKIYGDFTFLLDDEGELLDGASLTMGYTSYTPAEIFEGYAAVEIPNSDTWGDIVVTVPGDVVIPDQEFTVDVVVNYHLPGDEDTDGSSKLLDGVEYGEWDLNGYKTHVAFMPFGAEFSQSITVANTGSQDSAITIAWYVGEVLQSTLDITAAPKAVTDISKAVQAKAAELGISGDVSFDVIVNSPEDDIDVVALYYSKADANRLRTE